jgi:hypothetical protein
LNAGIVCNLGERIMVNGVSVFVLCVYISFLLEERAQRKLILSRNCELSFNLKLSEQDKVSLLTCQKLEEFLSMVIGLSQTKWSIEKIWGHPPRGNLRRMKIHPS